MIYQLDMILLNSYILNKKFEQALLTATSVLQGCQNASNVDARIVQRHVHLISAQLDSKRRIASRTCKV